MTLRLLALSGALAGVALAAGQAPPPKLSALAAIVMDAETGHVLYAKNGDLRLHPASTTKIMTGLLLAELCDPDETLTAPEDIEKVKESSLHLMPHEQVTAREMLYAVMLRSANDGCHTVAVHVAGSEKDFAAMMNDRAKSLGCRNTTFVNPHGLTDPGHLTTARDLALMAAEALKNPLFAKVVATKRHTVKRSLNQKDTLLVNRDKFLTADPRANGVKTGWTRAAGQCFVGSATADGTTIITAILKSEKWLEDQCALTDWAFGAFERTTLVRKGDTLGYIRVENASEPKSLVVAASDLTLLVPKGKAPEIRATLLDLAPSAPAKAGALVGYAEYALDKRVLGTVDGLLAKDVAGNVLTRIAHPFVLVGFAVLGGGSYLMRRKSRRMADGRRRKRGR